MKDKIIVITGSTSGIGAKLGLHLLKLEANVIFNYCNDKKKANEIKIQAEKINKHTCFFICADVSDECAVKKFVSEVTINIGIPDVLINNAGIACSQHIFGMNYNQWRDVFEVNTNGVFLCSKYFAKKMAKNKSGKILNVGSLVGNKGFSANCNYSASKAALIGLTRSLAYELNTFNISVNLIYPPSVKTKLNSHNYECGDDKDLDKIKSYIDFMTFLCSNNFHSITGQIFCLNNKIWGGA